MLDKFMRFLRSLNPLFDDVISLGYEGFSRKEIVEVLPVKRSQAYDLYAQTYKLACEFLSK